MSAVADVVITEGLVVNPGDTLVVRISDDHTPAEMQEFRAQAEKCLPGVKVVVIAADQLAVDRG